jgi:hypothetical protein
MSEPVYSYVKGQGWITSNPHWYIETIDKWFIHPDNGVLYPERCKDYKFEDHVDGENLKVGDIIPFGGRSFWIVTGLKDSHFEYYRYPSGSIQTHPTIRDNSWSGVLREA